MNWELELHKFLFKTFFYSFSDSSKTSKDQIIINSFILKSTFTKDYPINLIGKILFEAKLRVELLSKNNEIIYTDEKLFPQTSLSSRVEIDDYKKINLMFDDIIKFLNSENKNKYIQKKEILSLPEEKKVLILVCQLNSPDDFKVEKLIRTNNSIKNLDENYSNLLAYSIFAYWTGNINKVPEDLNNIIKNKIDNNGKYYVISFEYKNLEKKEVEKIFLPSVYDREDAIRYLSKNLNTIKISNTFSNIPDGCTIVSG